MRSRVLAMAVVIAVALPVVAGVETAEARRVAPAVRNAKAAVGLPAGFVLTDRASGQTGISGDQPLTDVAYLPDGSAFTTGKNGRVAWVPETADPVTLATLSVATSQDLGLTSLVLARDYSATHQIYIARATVDGANRVGRVSRFTVVYGANGPIGLTNEVVVLQSPADTDVHGLTGLVAAPDGTLWVSLGDSSGFTQGVVYPNSLRVQSIDDIHGKLLHINPDGTGVATNPFYDTTNPGSVRSKVYAYGFRSPFRLMLDPGSGTPIVGDVGSDYWEEVDWVKPGGNYGWPCVEGNDPQPYYPVSAVPSCAGPVANSIKPLLTYSHFYGTSITGGVLYRGTSYPAQYQDKYFFADYSVGKIWTLGYDAQGNLTSAPDLANPFATGIGGPVEMTTGPNGDIVYADIVNGTLRRLSYAPGNRPPTAQVTTTVDPATRTVTFDGTGSSDLDGDQITYSWDFGDGTPPGTGATVTHTYAASPSSFTATLTVRDPLGATGQATAQVVPSNHAPVVQLSTPPGGTTFKVGDSVQLGGTATDVEDGALPVHWAVDLIHCHGTLCHTHPGARVDGPSISQTFPDHGDDTSLRITATATDSAGVTSTKVYDAQPRLHTLSVSSSVPAQLQLNGMLERSIQVIAGSQNTVLAPATATDGVSGFSRWSDGGAASHNIVMPDADLTLTATYTTPVPASAIDQRYQSDAALRALLGQPTAPEVTYSDPTVHWRTYQGGVLLSSPATGVHELHGAILQKYFQLGWVGYGLPTTDESGAPGGRYNRFSGGGSISWSPSTGAHEVHGAIFQEWQQYGAESGFLGFPTTDETPTPGLFGRYNKFSGNGGSIYWNPTNGAHEVHGNVAAKWAQTGWEQGPLGYPTTDEQISQDGIGRYNHFSKGASVYWTPTTGAHEVHGAIWWRYAASGFENGPLGYPVTDELATPGGDGGRYNHFSKAGSIYFSPSTGAWEIYGAIRARWAQLGWERSFLGYPTSGEFAIPGGRRNNFQRGGITFLWATGMAVEGP